MALLPLDTTRLNGAAQRTRQFVAGFTPGQKAVTAIAGLGLVIGGVVFVARSSSPSYSTLYSNLQSSQAGQVTQALTAAHVPYELEDNGTTVAVPEANVNQERVNLAEAGLPSGGTITFQTLASTGITSSQFVQNVDYQQALEGQLASTIESIQGIQRAQVSLVVPDTSSFAIGNTQTPTASVLVDLANGTSLSASQVQGIVHLTASAVPGLTAGNVTVVDNNGDVLSSPGADASASNDAAQTTAYDNQLAASLDALVARVVGSNNADVQVHALLNFNQQTTTTNGFEVGKNGQPLTAPTSSNTTRETYTGNGATAAGVLGAGQPSTPTNSNGNYSQTATQTSAAVGQVTQTVDQAPGQVTKTAVAVLVNSSVVRRAQIPAIRQLIATAAGLNLSAGDSIAVTALPFSAPAALSRAKPASLESKIERGAPVGGVVVLILALFVFALRSSKRRRPAFEDIPMLPLGTGFSAGGNVGTTELGTAPFAMSAIAPAISPVTREVDDYIAGSASEVAQLMRTWSRERSGRQGA